MRKTRVRFAPSPTGYLHVGGARTALFNWFFARECAGTFVLRIEDTDLQRSSGEMVEGILDGLRWLGLEWNEGPYFQSDRLPAYQERARSLIGSGHAYFCFCRPDLLAAQRETAADQKADAQYDRTCRSLTQEEVQAKHNAGVPSAIRFRTPLDGLSVFTDAVFGRIEIQNSTIEDFVLLRSDGVPTYHLSVVVDDLDMEISHVIRGADHLSNTPKQVLLYEAFERELPVFAHLPLILGPDRSRLSKRHGATSVTAYRDMGFLPAAFRNFLALLGWYPGTKQQEIFSTDELIARFSLEGISKANAVFDMDKALWINSQHINSLSSKELLPYVREQFSAAGLWDDALSESRLEWTLNLVDLLKARARTLKDFVESGRPYLSDDYPMDQQAAKKTFKHDELKELLPELADRFERLDPFTLESTERALRQLAEERNIKAGILINATRTALTGSAVTPGIFDVITAIGQRRSVERLRKAVSYLSTGD